MAKKGEYVLYNGRLWEVLESEWCDEILDNMGYTIAYRYSITLFNADVKDRKTLEYKSEETPYETLGGLEYSVKIRDEKIDKLRVEIDKLEKEKSRICEKINIFKGNRN